MSPMAKMLCICRCHQEAKANYEEARHYARWDEALILSRSPILNALIPVDADDLIEAATALGCKCRDNHITAFSGKPWDFFGTPWTPEKDQDAQADGEGEG